MNSDFVQIESEELAKRVANEPDNRSRIRKIYQYVYGRDASEEEITLGVEYLRTEPMLEYDEQKAKPAAAGAGGRRGGRSAPAPAKAPVKPEVPAITENQSVGASSGSSGVAADAAPPLPEVSPTDAIAKAAAPMPDAGEVKAAEGEAAAAATPMGAGMMGGMGGRRGAGGGPAEVKYDATVWGRYAKVLFSSSEFLFIN
jgi:hypothetical protein